MTRTTTDVIFRISRFDPRGEDPSQESTTRDYTVPVPPGMVVLEALWYVKEHLDATLAFRASCRMGVCGSCAMQIHGRPTLACNTQVRDVIENGVVRLEPLPNFAVVRDLVPDLDPLFAAHRSVLPYVRRRREEPEQVPSRQLRQTPPQLLEYLQFSYCIKCGCCLAACPTVATDASYSGPQALSQAYRYLVDCRDEGTDERRELYSGDAGPWRCHFAGECSRVCPKGVDPARALQLLKRELVLDAFGRGKMRRRRAAEEVPRGEAQHCEGIPEAPAHTLGSGAAATTLRDP